ncbi:glycoside hydrolase family 28 protein [Chitinophaga silvisoli]|uniref:Glycoside hydrolase family 28 n=1 Tax=Chitinophaga silvisoli TaxID=2291814 RepID=A0A3E1NZ31_9BACT|nr:glycosyl hydrolase family 28 protein [Chitinophaga silvisoli]RFM33008.1 glycoside hydrolase family 28 [Chitinophaga silvisoli]
MNRIIVFCLLFQSMHALAQKEYPITRFGAKAGMRFDNAPCIQAAIDSATITGGTVIIPNGTFMTSTIFLKSNVTLQLDMETTLLGSRDRMDYGKSGPLALIVCKDQQNVRIIGGGMINGQGRELVESTIQNLREGKLRDDEWLKKRPSEKNRPNLLYFENCKGVLVKGVTLKDAASWVQLYKECTDVTIYKITVESNAYWNNDGIDIVDSKDVLIKGSFFNSADDAICLKSENPARLCENVTVKNCILRSSANGFKLGTGSLGGFKNIVVENLTVYDTYRSAIALEAVDGGSIENVKITNVRAYNTGNALFIRLGKRNTDARYSTVSNILVQKMEAEIPSTKPDIGYPQEGPLPKIPFRFLLPVVIAGIPGHLVTNVQLRNFDVHYAGGNDKAEIAPVPEQAAGYPEFTMFGDLPAWGLYIRHASGVQVEDFKLGLEKPDFRPALYFEDVKELQLQRVGVPDKEVINASRSETKTISY